MLIINGTNGYYTIDDDFFSCVVNWQELLCIDSEMSVLLEEKNRTGRPFGTDEFYAIVEKLTGRDTRPGRPGRPMQQEKKGNAPPDFLRLKSLEQGKLIV